jgi:hypothetical protein
MDYPAEIRAVRKQLPQQERATFIRDYKSLTSEAKEQFKSYLKSANLIEAGKLMGRDLSACQLPANNTSVDTITSKPPQVDSPNLAAPSDNDSSGTIVPVSVRFQNIISTYSDDIDTALVAEASKKYDKISGWNAMNIKEKTHSLLNLSS